MDIGYLTTEADSAQKKIYRNKKQRFEQPLERHNWK